MVQRENNAYANKEYYGIFQTGLLQVAAEHRSGDMYVERLVDTCPKSQQNTTNK